MPEEIKIRVVQESVGTAIKDAERDLERLKQGRAQLATAVPDLNAAPSPGAKESAAVAKAAQSEALRRNKGLVADAEEDLARAQAGGAGAGRIAELQSQVREQKLAGRFMREQGLGEDDALGKARGMVELQNQAKQRATGEKAASKEAADAQKAAASEAAAAEKTAAKEATDAQRAASAAEKAASREAADAQRAAARARVEGERHVTREMHEQAAVLKAQESRRAQIVNAAANFAESQAGAGGLGGVTSALGGIGGPGAMIGAAIAAMTVGLAAQFAQQGHAMSVMGMEDTASRTVAGRRSQRLSSFEGSASAAREGEMSAKDEIVQREADREKLAEEAKAKWWNPASWMRSLTGEAQNPTIENEMAITRAREKMASDSATKREKFTQEGGRDIEISEKIAAGDMAGARALEAKAKYHREIKSLLAGGASGEDAVRGADAKFAADIRQREQSMGTLIGARTGATAAARIAGLGDRQYAGARAAVGEQRGWEIKNTLDANHREAMNIQTRKNFSRPPMR